MTKEEIKRKLNSYTKEQLVRALSDILCFSTYEYIFYEIQRKIDASIYNDENKLISVAQEKWEKAKAEKRNYANYLTEKYGNKNIKLYELTSTEYDKYLSLMRAEQKVWEELSTLQDKQVKRFEKELSTKKYIG